MQTYKNSGPVVVDKGDDVGQAIDNMKPSRRMRDYGTALLRHSMDSVKQSVAVEGTRRVHIHCIYDLRRHGRSQLYNHIRHQGGHM